MGKILKIAHDDELNAKKEYRTLPDITLPDNCEPTVNDIYKARVKQLGTQKEASRRCGIDRSQLNAFLNNRKGWSISESRIARLSYYCGFLRETVEVIQDVYAGGGMFHLRLPGLLVFPTNLIEGNPLNEHSNRS